MDANLLSNLSVIAIAVLSAFSAALWLGITFWVLRDIRSRSRDPLIVILAGLIALALPFFGVILYLLLRPAQTIEEKYLSALEEETLIQEIERRPKMPRLRAGDPIKMDSLPGLPHEVNEEMRKMRRGFRITLDALPILRRASA